MGCRYQWSFNSWGIKKYSTKLTKNKKFFDDNNITKNILFFSDAFEKVNKIDSKLLIEAFNNSIKKKKILQEFKKEKDYTNYIEVP